MLTAGLVGWTAVLALEAQAPAPVLMVPPPAIKVALTFDDLPVHASLPPGVTRLDVVRGILRALAAHHVPPSYGLVNGNGLVDDPANAQVLKAWRDAGHLLGNHTFAHTDLHAVTAEGFLADVVANETVLERYMSGENWRIFRYPYLHEGDTPEKRQAAAAMLRARGYTLAQVTMNFDDWAFNDPYARCSAAGQTAAVAWIKDAYMRRARTSLAVARERAWKVLGREMAHVLLLHAGVMNIEMLPTLLDMLEAEGVTFVSLGDAQSDPDYTVTPGMTARSAGTLMDQLMAAKGVAVPAPPDDTLRRLSELCR